MSKELKDQKRIELMQPVKEDKPGNEVLIIPQKLLEKYHDVGFDTILECCKAYNLPELAGLFDLFVLYTRFCDSYYDNPEKWGSFYNGVYIRGIKALNVDFPDFTRDLSILIMQVNTLIEKKKAENKIVLE